MAKPTYPNLRPKPENLGVTLLAEGEKTKTMRIRAAADVIAWAVALSAAERGVLLTKIHEGIAPSRIGQDEKREAIRREWASGKHRNIRAMERDTVWSKSAIGRALRGIPKGSPPPINDEGDEVR
jgi:hypothetical protein